jgi:hypothetical protein
MGRRFRNDDPGRSAHPLSRVPELPSIGVLHPASTYAKWAGITVNSAAELVLLLILLGLPFCLYLSIRTNSERIWTYSLAVDVVFSAMLYATAYFLLSPPLLVAGRV